MWLKNSNRLEKVKNRLSKTAKEELSNEIAVDDKVASIILIIVNGLLGYFLIIHQTAATGFFVPNLGLYDMIMIYGIPIYWITTSALILVGQKHPSRDLDSYGGLFFATFAFGWLLVVFPFDTTYFTAALPEALRFLVQWVTTEIALALLFVFFVVHLVLAIYSLILRFYVREARKK
jgi:hypothetical protein